jgi:hypothetical protein
MKRPALFLAVLFYSCLALAQSSEPEYSAAPSSPVQVVYSIDGSTLTTYNVDPQTFQATQVGSIALAQSIYPGLITSANGRFLYYTAYLDYSQTGQKLYVYDTNASGAPGSSPVQILDAHGLISMLADPKGTFFYVVRAGQTGPQFTPYSLLRYTMNASTGKINQPVVEANYQLDSGTGGSQLCTLGILGMNAAGTELYDEIFCSYHGGDSATYNERTVNTQTGALGPDVQIYSWNNSYSGYENVQFANNLMFDFINPNNYQQNVNLVNVYKIQPNVTTPLISCGASMLAACGDFIWPLAHPSGKYVFLTDPSVVTDIGRLESTTKSIVQTSSIPYEVQHFSPDGSVAYAANDVNGALIIQIYGFNISTGAVTAGDAINVPSDLDSWFTAIRY